MRALPTRRDDVEIVAGLRRGDAWARAAVYDKYGEQVEGILVRLLGRDGRYDIADLLHDVFVEALRSLGGLREGEALRAWLETIASRTAYRAIRKRRMLRWLSFWEGPDLPDVPVDAVDPAVRRAYVRALELLDSLPADERVPFLLRSTEEWEHARIATACGVSLSTVKRRIARATERIAKAARADEDLRQWLEEGER